MISKNLNSLLHRDTLNIPVTEFDTLELARQLTILESKLFCAVHPDDLLETGRKSIQSLKALSMLSNQITGWVADNILNERDAKKRTALLKFYIKLADVSCAVSLVYHQDIYRNFPFLKQKCLILNNFSTLYAILAGLNSSIVYRLQKTWDVSEEMPAYPGQMLTKIGASIKVSRHS